MLAAELAARADERRKVCGEIEAKAARSLARRQRKGRKK